jgi:formylglycine-generating enzyme required for sulfatase activity
MKGIAARGIVILAVLGPAACILDFDGLSGGTPGIGANDGGVDGADQRDATGGDANVEASGDGGDGGAGGCPGIHGPTPVRVTSGPTSFCIDATEVTNGHYAEFLASGPATSSQSEPCLSTNLDFTPAALWPGDGTLPVVHVDWCDAYAYCAWAGKRLCGKIGGGRLEPTARNDAKQSQWFFACSANDTRKYPYGDTYDATNCIVGSGRQPAGSKATCEGGFPGIYDLSASVEEWVDECSADVADCLARGSNYSESEGFECTTTTGWLQPRMLAEAWRGFRCCSP